MRIVVFCNVWSSLWMKSWFLFQKKKMTLLIQAPLLPMSQIQLRIHHLAHRLTPPLRNLHLLLINCLLYSCLLYLSFTLPPGSHLPPLRIVSLPLVPKQRLLTVGRSFILFSLLLSCYVSTYHFSCRWFLTFVLPTVADTPTTLFLTSTISWRPLVIKWIEY